MLRKEIIIILFILLLSFIMGWLLPTRLAGPEIYNDSIQYDNIARSVMEKGEYPKKEDGFNFLLPPGYPFFLIFAYALFGYNYFAVYFLQYLLLGGIAVFTYLICRKHFNLTIIFSAITAFLTLFWPYFILYSSIMYTEVFYTFLLIILVYFLLEFLENGKKTKGFLAGLFCGLTVLTRPIPLFIPFWLVFFLYIFYKKKIFTPNVIFNKKNIAIVFVGFFLVLLPWIAYCYARTGQFTLVANDPVQLYEYGIAVIDIASTGAGEQVPLQEIFVAKAKNFFVFWKSGGGGTNAIAILERVPAGALLLLSYHIGYYFIIGLFFSSVYFFRKKEILTVWLIVVYVWLVHTVIFPMPRYTLPIIPLVIIVAMYAFKEFCEKKRSNFLA